MLQLDVIEICLFFFQRAPLPPLAPQLKKMVHTPSSTYRVVFFFYFYFS
jgi:hypothetical protein